MSDAKRIVAGAKNTLAIVGAIALTCAATLAATHQWRGTMNKELTELQGLVGGQQASLADKEKELANMQSNILTFRSLQKQGLNEAPNRSAWIDQLLAARKALGLPETLTYTLKPPVPLTAADETAEGAQPAAADPESPLAHNLEFGLRDIHEEELLAFVSRLGGELHARFRLQSCRLESAGERGLSSQCSLRLFTLPAKGSLPEQLAQPPLSCRVQPCC